MRRPPQIPEIDGAAPTLEGEGNRGQAPVNKQRDSAVRHLLIERAGKATMLHQSILLSTLVIGFAACTSTGTGLDGGAGRGPGDGMTDSEGRVMSGGGSGGTGATGAASDSGVGGMSGGQQVVSCGNHTCASGQVCCTGCDGSKACGASCTGHACPVDGGSGAVACGGTICSAGDVCVNPCCRGSRPACEPLPDAGVCPMGSFPCPDGTGIRGCFTPCTPPPPYCQPASKALPVGCTIGTNGQATCGCA